MIRSFSRWAVLGLVPFAPALLGADGKGCSAPPHGSGGTGGSPPALCAEQNVEFQNCSAAPTFDGYRWDGFSCAIIKGCGSCRGADCGALYPDQASCLAAHTGCAGYDCSGDPRAEYRAVLDEHTSCTSDAECEIVPLDCCSAYANTSINETDFTHLVRQAKYCFFQDTSPFSGCLALCPNLAPAACVNGRCAARP
jgi:hypothetical protein